MVDGVVEQFDKLRVVNVDFAPEPKNVVNHRNFRIEHMCFFAEDSVSELRLTSSVWDSFKDFCSYVVDLSLCGSYDWGGIAEHTNDLSGNDGRSIFMSGFCTYNCSMRWHIAATRAQKIWQLAFSQKEAGLQDTQRCNPFNFIPIHPPKTMLRVISTNSRGLSTSRKPMMSIPKFSGVKSMEERFITEAQK